MKRRTFLATALAAVNVGRLRAAVGDGRWDAAADVLAEATLKKQVDAAVLHIQQREDTFTQPFGTAPSGDAMFLLGSISKPINVAAVMVQYDQGRFQLDDKVQNFLPQFQGDGREEVTIRHLLTHVSGLPDQLPENNALRSRQAPVEQFIDRAMRTPLSFRPGTKYQYSSMGILLATRIGELLSGKDRFAMIDSAVFQPLRMRHSAQGVGRFLLEDLVPCQSAGAAPESGSGEAEARQWGWNSPYWRKLGVPWGGTHASAPDVGRFLCEFLYQRGEAVRPETARLMIRNHNPKGFKPRGLGFAVGPEAGCPVCSDQTFGHTGSTGTICWADPATETVCVVLTSLPSRAAMPHPRTLASDRVAASVRR